MNVAETPSPDTQEAKRDFLPNTESVGYRWFLRALKLNAQPFVDFRRVIIEGVDRLDYIDGPVIFLVNHPDDLAVQMATTVLGEHGVPVIVTNQGTQHRFRDDPGAFLGMKAVDPRGKYFSPISYRKEEGEIKGFFDLDDILELAQKMSQGWCPVIAAHNPSTFEDNFVLPDRGGRIGPALAELTGATVIPVAIEPQQGYDEPIIMDKPWRAINRSIQYLLTGRRSGVIFHIGEPIQFGFGDGQVFDQQELVDRITHISEEDDWRQAQGERPRWDQIIGGIFRLAATRNLTISRIRRLFSRSRSASFMDRVHANSRTVMSALADMLPEKQKGRWR